MSGILVLPAGGSGSGADSPRGRVIGRLLPRGLEEADLDQDGITPRRIGHTFATHPIRNGVSVRTVQELLGHADLQTTARCLHSDTKAKQEAVGKLGAVLAAK